MKQIEEANKLANEFISNHPFQKEIVEEPFTINEG